MSYFQITSNPSSAQIFVLKGFNRSLVGATPMQLDALQFGGTQIILTYDNKEKAIFLDPNKLNYFVDFGEVRSDFNKYGIYLNFQLQYININQFEDLVRSGHKFDTIYIDNKMKMITEVPELRAIHARYYPSLNETYENPTVVNTPVHAVQNSKTDNTLLYVIFGLLFMGGLVWFIVSSTKKMETVETASAADSVVISNQDAAYIPIDTAAMSTVTPEMGVAATPVDVIKVSPEEQQRNNLKKVGVSTFNDYSSTKPNYDGCGSYFSLSKSANENGNYVFTGMISSFFSNNVEGAFVEMVIDGNVEHFSYYESGNSGNYIFLRGTAMTLEIHLDEIGSGEEMIIYSGEMKLTKNGTEYKFPLYGQSGC